MSGPMPRRQLGDWVSQADRGLGPRCWAAEGLKHGDLVVSQAWSGDIFRADLSSNYRHLQLLISDEGAMHWTDNMCIPGMRRTPKTR